MKTKTKKYAIIMCAGSGSRMGLSYNKLLYQISGKALIEYTLDNFTDALSNNIIDEIVLVCSENGRAEFEKTAQNYHTSICAGGETRCESVLRGLRFLKKRGAHDNDIALICDGARPNTTPELIAACAETAEKYGGAVAACPVTDTLRLTENGKPAGDIPRENARAVQTPQAFIFSKILSAYEKMSGKNNSEPSRTAKFLDFTDDAGVFAAAGFKYDFVSGPPDNYKITLPEDLERFINQRTAHSAQRTMNDDKEINKNNDIPSSIFHLPSSIPTSTSQFSILNSQLQIRIGIGSDTHRLVPGRPLILGGVNIPFERGLMGHSDADALVHAVTDALLSAAGLRDIGFYFPDADPKYKGADSLKLLSEARSIIEREGYQTVNISAVIQAEAPRLYPFIDEMRENLASVLNINARDAGIGAKSGEGIGFIGRGEGISVTAIAFLKKI